MDTNSTDERTTRRAGSGGGNPALWVGVIVIGAIVILAIQVGGLRGFVQH